MSLFCINSMGPVIQYMLVGHLSLRRMQGASEEGGPVNRLKEVF